MRKLKVVLIGAGSASFGRGAITDLLTAPDLKESQMHLCLVDINPTALERMYKFALLLKKNISSSAEISRSTDRAKVLEGADYVVVSVSVNRWKLWEKDFYVPAVYGFKHVNGENGGPGGAFHTLRSLKLVVPIAQDMEKLCPSALLINYTNPESRVILGISKLTKIKSVGLCHGVYHTLTGISQALSIPEPDIDLTIAGINHFHWVMGITNKKTGDDLLPLFNRKMAESDCGFDFATRQLYDLFGHLTYPSRSHPCEYLPFGHYLAGPAILDWGIGEVARNLRDTARDHHYEIDGALNKPSYEQWSAEQGEKIERLVGGDSSLLAELTAPTPELLVRIISDIEMNRGRREISVNVPNTTRAIENLQDDVIIEVPAIVDKNGIAPVKIGRLPEGLAGICQLQACIQNLLVEAYSQKSKHALYQAIAVDPVVDNLANAKAMMEHLLRLEAEYLPELR